MTIQVGTWMLSREDAEGKEHELAAVHLSAAGIKVVPISQYLELRDKDGAVFATLTWPSTTKIRKVGV